MALATQLAIFVFIFIFIRILHVELFEFVFVNFWYFNIKCRRFPVSEIPSHAHAGSGSSVVFLSFYFVFKFLACCFSFYYLIRSLECLLNSLRPILPVYKDLRHIFRLFLPAGKFLSDAILNCEWVPPG